MKLLSMGAMLHGVEKFVPMAITILLTYKIAVSLL